MTTDSTDIRAAGSPPPPRAIRATRLGPRRARRWTRTGAAIAFGTGSGLSGATVGWSWEIRRDSAEKREIRVEVSPGPYRVTDLPAESRNAIRSRGATAVDSFLDEDDPPARLSVSTQGIIPHYGGSHLRD